MGKNLIPSVLVTIVLLDISSTYTQVVYTTNGPIKGSFKQWRNLSYYSYSSIPYAESPVGELRFMPPVPKKSWTGILDATRESAVCPQDFTRYKKNEMSEDCLYLNVLVPGNITPKSLPVFVFVHGGAFRSLSGDTRILFGPQMFLKQGVIWVSINFRLGALGFLSLDIKEASGNAALKDIILALKWINKNIERFGGDPNQITLGGQSSGAAMVHYLLLSKKSSNLFKQVILFSGSAVCHRSVARHAKNNALLLAKELGLPTNNVYDILNKLTEINVFDIINAENNLFKYDEVVLRPFSLFVPTIEIESEHAVITSDPVKLVKLGFIQNVPILAGFNNMEGIYGIPKIKKEDKQLNMLKHNMEYSIPSDIEYPLGSKMSKALAKSISKYYFNSDLSNFTINNLVDLITDSQYVYAIDSWLKIYKGMNNSNVVYYYNFNYDGDLNWAKIQYSIDFPGTAHGDELGYIFITNVTEPLLHKADRKSKLVMKIMTTVLSNFIKFGNPTPQDFSGGFEWTDYRKNGTILRINDNPSESTHSAPLLGRLNFWYNVYAEYYRYVENGGGEKNN